MSKSTKSPSKSKAKATSTKSKKKAPAKKKTKVAAKSKAKAKTKSKAKTAAKKDNETLELLNETGRRKQNINPPVERRKRRRQIDPTTCERDYTDQEIEFMQAMDLSLIHISSPRDQRGSRMPSSA